MQKLADISLFEKLGGNHPTCDLWVSSCKDDLKVPCRINVQNELTPWIYEDLGVEKANLSRSQNQNIESAVDAFLQGYKNRTNANLPIRFQKEDWDPEYVSAHRMFFTAFFKYLHQMEAKAKDYDTTTEWLREMKNTAGYLGYEAGKYEAQPKTDKNSIMPSKSVRKTGSDNMQTQETKISQKSPPKESAPKNTTTSPELSEFLKKYREKYFSSQRNLSLSPDNIPTKKQLFTSLLETYFNKYLEQWGSPKIKVFKQRLDDFSEMTKENINDSYNKSLFDENFLKDFEKSSALLAVHDAGEDQTHTPGQRLTSEDVLKLSKGLGNKLNMFMDRLKSTLHSAYVDAGNQRLREVYATFKQRYPYSQTLARPSDYTYLVDKGWSYIEDKLNVFQNTAYKMRDSLITKFGDALNTQSPVTKSGSSETTQKPTNGTKMNPIKKETTIESNDSQVIKAPTFTTQNDPFANKSYTFVTPNDAFANKSYMFATPTAQRNK